MLVLDPSSGSDDLSGSLAVKQHDPETNKIPGYEALSYTWGDQTDPDYIALRSSDVESETSKPQDQDADDYCSPRKLAIGRNLGAALRQLRHTTNTRVLWCDSICINQRDLDERAAQVRRMGHIYTYASRVIAWLGPADDQSRLAMRTLSELAAYIDFSNAERDLQVNQLHLKPETAEVFTNPDKSLPLPQEQWQAIEALISRSWFRRLWVRQEIALAGKDTIAVAGNDSIPWIHFSGAFELIAIKRTTSVLTAVHLSVDIYVVRTFSHMKYLKDFATLVAFTHGCGVTDPRDLVYGLLGIASGEFTSKITIDYTKDVKEVYTDALVQASKWHQNLILLSFCDSASEPTWVPDLHKIGGLRAMIRGVAGLASPSAARVLSKTHAEVRGVRCDAITECLGPSTEEEGRTQEQVRAILIKVARRFLGPDPDSWAQDKLQQFCLALLTSEQAVQPSTFDKYKAYLTPWVRTAGSADALPGDFQVQLYPLIYYLLGRALYLTRMGYLVLGPRGCQHGDLVCVFLGSNVPTVLRATGNGEYHIKGPVCHPALFFGEALLGELPEGWRPLYPNRAARTIWENQERERQDIDPRLSGMPLPNGWELRRRQDGTAFFYNAEQDRLTDFDPRASEEELQKRGVKIQTFTLT